MSDNRHTHKYRGSSHYYNDMLARVARRGTGLVNSSKCQACKQESVEPQHAGEKKLGKVGGVQLQGPRRRRQEGLTRCIVSVQ